METLQLCLRIATSGTQFKITIELFEIDLSVESIDNTLRDAVQNATTLCAEALARKGYAVTQKDVILALETALTGVHVDGSGPSKEEVWDAFRSTGKSSDDKDYSVN